MRLDGLRTGSWVYEDAYPPNYHLWPVFDYLGDLSLGGAKCLDIGSFDGMTAFVMAEHGAARVDATCKQDLERFRLARALQGYSSVAYYPETDLGDIARDFPSGEYDLVVISAMLHHLTSPLDALLEVRRLVRPQGMFLLESIVRDGEAPSLLLNTELDDPVFGAPTIFVPTPSALRGLLRFCSFEIVSECRLLGGRAARDVNYDRLTFLARAVKPSQVTGRTGKAEEIQQTAPMVGPLNFEALETDEATPSTIGYAGGVESRSINIWTDRIDAPLMPESAVNPERLPTRYSIGHEQEFLRLASKHPDGAIGWEDIHLLGVRYPGEGMPEGMTWSAKQYGNLHALDYIRRFGLANVLEVGPGFNLYFPNHLPAWCSYTGLDSEGFYDESVIALANARRPSAQMIDGLLGRDANALEPDSYDACVSVSVLEHVPPDEIAAVCEDMIRVLRPGGWALHSIDLRLPDLDNLGALWLDGLRAAGFKIDGKGLDKRFGGDVEPPAQSAMFLEPLSLRARFYGKYRRTIWGEKPTATVKSNVTTILVAARKP